MSDQNTQANAAKELFKPIQKQGRFSRKKQLLIAAFFILAALIAWFISAASAVLIRPTPAFAQTQIGYWLKLPFGQDVLMLPGKYTVSATAPGYHPYEESFELGDDSLELNINMKKLPGQLKLNAKDSWTQQVINDELKSTLIQLSPLKESYSATTDFPSIEAGQYQLRVEHPLYLPLEQNIEITGMGKSQEQELVLQANYGLIHISHKNPGAQLRVNEKEENLSEEKIALAVGDYDVCLEQEGYKSQCHWVELDAKQELAVDFAELLPADASLNLSSTPSAANVLVNGQFQGQTPITLALSPGEAQSIKLYKDGYQRFSKTVTLKEKEQQTLQASLLPVLGKVSLKLFPSSTKVFLNNKALKLNKGVVNLASHPQTLRFEAPGYASQSHRITPSQNRPLQLDIQLLTLAEQKFANLKPVYRNSNGEQLKLFKPKHSFTMGASRREQGRRANESQRRVKLNRAFYLATHEVSNKAFRQFKSSHNSNHSKGVSLNNDKYPVANISWQDAALYCNWLSQKEKLKPFYKVQQGKVRGFDESANGYRLPTEAEWAWIARYDAGKMKKYAWGDRMQHSASKASYAGNYADRSAATQVGSILNNYDDGFAASAPSGKFPANKHGIYDLGGNMAEWVHDVYGISTGLNKTELENPMGKQSGQHYVIRGPNWTSGTMSDLRLAFRDYGNAGKRHVGFRIARNAL